MNKESSSTMVKRGRTVDKVVIMLGTALAAGVIAFTAFTIIHKIDENKHKTETTQTVVEQENTLETQENTIETE